MSRCKPGCLAIGNYGSNMGKLMRVVEDAGPPPSREREIIQQRGMQNETHWVVRSLGEPLKVLDSPHAQPTAIAPDSWLTPLDFKKGEDEMLILLGRPMNPAAASGLQARRLGT